MLQETILRLSGLGNLADPIIVCSGRCESSEHLTVYRPWGWYDSIEVGKHFQAKRLHINPGTKLSVQIHNKRA